MRDPYEHPPSAQTRAWENGAEYPAGNSIIDYLGFPSPPPGGAMALTDAGSTALLEAHATA